jgi:hypothetical protein
MLRNRFDKASCDSDGVAECVRCNVITLCRTVERLLAATSGGRRCSGKRRTKRR